MCTYLPTIGPSLLWGVKNGKKDALIKIDEPQSQELHYVATKIFRIRSAGNSKRLKRMPT